MTKNKIMNQCFELILAGVTSFGIDMYLSGLVRKGIISIMEARQIKHDVYAEEF